jgi:hypothetical protein
MEFSRQRKEGDVYDSFFVNRTGKPSVKFSGKLLSSVKNNDRNSVLFSIKLYEVATHLSVKRYLGHIACGVDAKEGHRVLYTAALVGGPGFDDGSLVKAMENWWLPTSALNNLKAWHDSRESTEQKIRDVYLRLLSLAYDGAGDVFTEEI